MNAETQQQTPKIQRVIAVMWPSFLVAGVGVIAFFSVIDPFDLIDCGVVSEVSRLGSYTIGFFLFWAMTLSACMLTCYFQRPCHRIRSDDSARPPQD